jgi:iron complex transport system ATP-binding protein
MTPALEARAISAHAGGKALVRGADLTLHAGQLVVIVGPNGSGKTSLMRVLAGVIKHEGFVALQGEDCRALKPDIRAQRCAYLPQTRPLVWPLRVRDVVALGLPASLPGNQREARVDQALSACDLDALSDRACDTLSGGEVTRVHLARMLASGAPLWLADEPVAALDPRHQFGVMQLARNFVRHGGAALFVLHDLALAAHFADQIVIVKEGRIIAQGTPDEVMSSAQIFSVFGVSSHRENGHLVITGPVPDISGC